MKKLLISISLLFLSFNINATTNIIVTEKEIQAAINAKGSNYGLQKGIDAYLKGQYTIAYTWFKSYKVDDHTNESIQYFADLDMNSDKMSAAEKAKASKRGIEIKYRIISAKAGDEKERKKADAKKAAERAKKTIIQARIDSKDNPGFRDLKPGMPYDDYMAICPRVRCYGIDNIKFSKQTSGESGVILISKIELDMGPITSDGLFLDIVNDLIESDSNIYRKMKRTMDTKYALDFEFSERDRQLFNEKEKRELLVSYSNGQVVLKINRRKKENSYSEDLWLYIEYRDVEYGKLFLKRNRPVAANLNDF